MNYRDPLGALMLPSPFAVGGYQMLGQQEFLMLAAAAQQRRLAGNPGLFLQQPLFPMHQLQQAQFLQPFQQRQACAAFGAGPHNLRNVETEAPASSGETAPLPGGRDTELADAGRVLQMLSAAAWREASPSSSEVEGSAHPRKRSAPSVREPEEDNIAGPSKAARVASEEVNMAVEERRAASEASTDEASDDDEDRSSSRGAPERRSERASGRLSTATVDPSERQYKDRDKEWAALTTWLRMNLHQPRTTKREVLFLGVKDLSGKWVFRLNNNITWDDVSPETKTRLRTLVSEASAAYQRKYPKRPKDHWRSRTQKYRAPGGARTHLVPLSDLLETLQAIFFEYEGGSPPPLAPQQPDCGSPAEAEAA